MLRCTCSLALLAALLVFAVRADETPKEKPKKPDPTAEAPAKKSTTHKVEKGPFKVEVNLKGILESQAMTEVLVSPEAFTPDNRGQLRVLKVVEHGAHVKKGDQLVWFDMERIDQIITDLDRDRALTDLSLKLALEDLNALEKATPIDLANAERGKKLADEDLTHFLTQDKDYLIKMFNYQVKSSADYLAYAKEELQQLEKMYKSSDLTESTEEIILKRQRDYVERASFYLKMAEYNRDYFFKVGLPRKEESFKENDIKQTLTLEKTRTNLPLMLNQKRLSLDKLKFERERTADKLQKFKKDRDAMVVTAPADGIVYFGKCVRGNWSPSSMESRLQRGGNVMADEVILTIVQPRPVFVRAGVDEKDFGNVRAGMQGKVVPTPLPDLKLAAKIDKVSAIPVSTGHFEARLSLDNVKEPKLVPGMACTVKLIAYQKADALAVPSTAVFAEDSDEDSHYVYTRKDDKDAKVPVTLGKKSATKVEILTGLKDGDQILLEKPMKK